MDEMWICIIMYVRPQCSSSSLTQGECLCLVSVSLAHCALRPSGYSWGQNGRKHTHSQIHTLVQTLFFLSNTHTHIHTLFRECDESVVELQLTSTLPWYFIDQPSCHQLIISSSVSATYERFLIPFNQVRNLAHKTRNQ